MADLPTKKGSELPLAGDLSDDDQFFGVNQNGVTKRAIASQLLAYVLSKRPSVNAKEYGAVGDGVTLDLGAVQALVNSVSSSGGGTVYFPRGNYVITGLKVPCNVFLLGAGASATFLSYVGEAGLVGIEFTYRATSYNLAGFSGLTPYNTGAPGAAAVKTPVLTDVFTRSQRYIFSDFAIRGVSGNSVHMAIGDCASAVVQRFFIQGPYVAQNADAGQLQDVGILLKGERGVVNADISAYKMRGVRTGLQVSDFAEGFSLHDGEMVGSWEAVVLDSNPSKPGGFIHDNHFNTAYRGIRMTRRRHITVHGNQYYRDSSFFAHGLGYRAIDASSCAGLNLGVVQTRIGTGYADEGLGVALLDTTDTSIQGISGGEAGTLTKALRVEATAANLGGGVSVGLIQAETLPVWAEFVGAVNDIDIQRVNERGTAATAPIIFSGTGADKTSIKLPKTSTATADYLPIANRTAAFNRDVVCRAAPPLIKESLVAGSGAYVVNYYFSVSGALNGDTFTFKLTQIGGSNSTLNLFSGASTASPANLATLAAAAAGTNQFRVWTLVFNGTAWEIMAELTSTK